MTFRRLGGTRDLTVDVRVVAATNKELADEVERGRFRLDLYHRLDVFHIRVPPLRDRREDILPLAAHFLARFATRMRKPRGALRARDRAHAAALRLPGQRARAAQPDRARRHPVDRRGRSRRRASCSRARRAAGRAAPTAFFARRAGRRRRSRPTSTALERAYIARLLEFTGGNRTQVARLLGVSYPTVAKKIADYGLG